MNSSSIPKPRAAANRRMYVFKVPAYGTDEVIAQICLEETGGHPAAAAWLVRRYVAGKAAQQEIIKALTAAVVRSQGGEHA